MRYQHRKVNITGYFSDGEEADRHITRDECRRMFQVFRKNQELSPPMMTYMIHSQHLQNYQSLDPIQLLVLLKLIKTNVIRKVSDLPKVFDAFFG